MEDKMHRKSQDVPLAIKGKVLTNVECRRSDLTYKDLCMICGEEEEDLDHLLRACRVALDIWRRTYSPRNFNLRRSSLMSV
nr:uncharacterized protein LOC109163410 [Ipomoea trifida]